jgi:RND family efflux transporter MFP subunit
MEGTAVRTPFAPGLKPALYTAAAIGVLTVAGCGTSTHESAPLDEREAVAVSVERVSLVDLPSFIEAGGTVQAGSTAHITSRVVAPIQHVHVSAGDRVRRGQTLVTLDARELTAHADRATAMIRAATDSARAAESRTQAEEASLRLATATHARISALADRKSATPQELDQAVAALRAAEARVQMARSESAAAAAELDTAKAASEAAAVARSYAVLIAPFDGIVADRLADPGSLAAPGAPLLVVEQEGPARFEVRVDASRAASITRQQPAEVRIDSGDPEWLSARVIEVGRTDVTSHSFLVKLELPVGATVRTGAFGRARFAGPARRTLTVPATSLIRRAGLVFAFTTDADGRSRLRPVVAGAVAEGRAEILAGLQEGDTVVANPPPSLLDGTPLRIEPSTTPAGGRS